MNHLLRYAGMLTLVHAMLAQAPPRTAAKAPFQTQSSSTLKYGIENNADIIEITNVSFELVGFGEVERVTGLPCDLEHLVCDSLRE